MSTKIWEGTAKLTPALEPVRVEMKLLGRVLLAGALTISLFSSSFYLVSLGVRDIALPRTQSRALRRHRNINAQSP